MMRITPLLLLIGLVCVLLAIPEFAAQGVTPPTTIVTESVSVQSAGGGDCCPEPWMANHLAITLAASGASPGAVPITQGPNVGGAMDPSYRYFVTHLEARDNFVVGLEFSLFDATQGAYLWEYQEDQNLPSYPGGLEIDSTGGGFIAGNTNSTSPVGPTAFQLGGWCIKR